MELSIYKNQDEVEKVYKRDNYDLMYGTIEDILQILDDVGEQATDTDFYKVLSENREKLNRLLKDVFPEITDDELRRTKVKDLIPFIFGLFMFVQESFKAKN